MIFLNKNSVFLLCISNNFIFDHNMTILNDFSHVLEFIRNKNIFKKFIKYILSKTNLLLQYYSLWCS